MPRRRIIVKSGESKSLVYILDEQNNTFDIVVKKNASLYCHIIVLGGENATHSIHSHVIGSNAVSIIDCIVIGGVNDRIAISVRNTFDAPNGTGEITMRGVAKGNSQMTLNGFIEITEQGVGTNTFLSEKILMLDPTAKVDAVPKLEIRTNDVKASHSASVSKISAEDLFYFASRGIPKTDAQRMLVDGFLNELIERIPDAKARDEVRRKIDE